MIALALVVCAFLYTCICLLILYYCIIVCTRVRYVYSIECSMVLVMLVYFAVLYYYSIIIYYFLLLPCILFYSTIGMLGGDGSGVRDSVVNQLLAKMDGIKVKRE